MSSMCGPSSAGGPSFAGDTSFAGCPSSASPAVEAGITTPHSQFRQVSLASPLSWFLT